MSMKIQSPIDPHGDLQSEDARAQYDHHCALVESLPIDLPNALRDLANTIDEFGLNPLYIHESWQRVDELMAFAEKDLSKEGSPWEDGIVDIEASDGRDPWD